MSEGRPTEGQLRRAREAFARHRKDWTFLGYDEAIATAILADFFAIPRPRNPSQKPLNVLSMVGRGRVKAIVETLREADGDD